VSTATACLARASRSADAAVAVLTAGNPDAVRKDVAAAVRTIDPDLPLVNVRTMTEIVRERLASDRLNVALYGGLAAVALLLAALGVYGVMAFSVAQRAHEIGLRMALGAGQRLVRVEILREGLTLAAGGLAVGVVGAYALGRAMQSTCSASALSTCRCCWPSARCSSRLRCWHATCPRAVRAPWIR
jgi:putative ABC transport system permease protein